MNESFAQHSEPGSPRLRDRDRLQKVINRALIRAEDRLRQACKQVRLGQDPALTFKLLTNAMVAFAQAKESLLETVTTAGQGLPKTVALEDDQDVATVKRLTQAAAQMENMAEVFRCLARGSEEQEANARIAEEKKRRRIRVAMAHLLWQNLPEVSRRWVARIKQCIPEYKEVQTVAEVNRRLLNAMIERLLPDGDAAALVYAAQYLVDIRFERLKIESVQAATKMFESVGMEFYMEFKSQGSYDMVCSCWPLLLGIFQELCVLPFAL